MIREPIYSEQHKAGVRSIDGQRRDRFTFYGLLLSTSLALTQVAWPEGSSNVTSELALSAQFTNDAESYQSKGAYAQAEPLYERALAIREKILGAEHPDTATSLNNLALLYYSKGAYAKAEPLYERALAIREKVLGTEHPDTATSLNNLALLYYSKGAYAKAEPLYQRALAINEKVLGPENPDTATSLNNLALLYFDIGAYARAESLYQRALAISEKTLGPEHPDTATTLNNLAHLYKTIGAYAKAESSYLRSLGIDEKILGPEHPDTARDLNNLAQLYFATGAYAKAEPLHRRALAIREKALGREHPDTATSLNNLALLYEAMGAYAKAESLDQRALAIRDKVLGPEHLQTAASLNNLAYLYYEMGAYSKAEPLYQRALAIHEKVLGTAHPSTATSLNNLAVLYGAMGAYAKAQPLYQRSLAIREKVLGPEHPDTATSLNNLATLYDAMDAFNEAEPLLKRALAIDERTFGPEHPNTARILRNLARLYMAMGIYAKAEHEAERALRIASCAQSPTLLAQVLDTRADLYSAEHQPELAIFWGKQAVNTLQGLRADLKPLDQSLQQSFLQDHHSTYTRLADRLIDQGRLPEAEQVLAMLKQQEYFDFVRGNSDVSSEAMHANLTGSEQGWQAKYQAISAKLVALGEEHRVLEQQQPLAADGQSRLRQINADLQIANQAFDAAVSEIESAAKGSDAVHQAQLAGRAFKTSRQPEVIELNEKAGGGVVLLQYIVLQDKLRILLTTGEVQKAFGVPVTEQELNHAVAALQEALRSPQLDARIAAKHLYDLLITPISEDLRQAHAKMLMLSLDGTLRYIPFAALYDGQDYLIARYATAIFNEAEAAGVARDPQRTWRVAGLGRAEGFPGFRPLPGVRQELEGIIREEGKSGGILNGVIYMDASFTQQALTDVVSARYPVIHLASHFHFSPAGSEADSFLLLGDGTQLSLADLHKYRLPKVDLLALSACETAVGGSQAATANGREVEGMATEAQELGAGSVLATLWSVYDSSTAQIMEQFYQGHQRSLSKAEALREAQLAVMHAGPSGPQTLASSRSLTNTTPIRAGDPQGGRFATDPNHPYAHPYYWAPFILMGNWL